MLCRNERHKMYLDVGDSVLATIKQISSDKVLASTERWDNISQLQIAHHNENVELFPGKSIPVEIDQISGEVASASSIRGAYARYVWPGNVITLTVTEFTESGLTIGEYDAPNCNRVCVTGAVPTQTVEVRIIKLSDGTTIGETVNKKSRGLQIGDQITACIKKGATNATPKEGEFDIYLPIEDDFPISSEVTVEITNLDGRVEAQLIDLGRLPIPTNELSAEITQASTEAHVIDGSYEVTLIEPALATGKAKIRIKERGAEMPTATVVSYEDLLPDVGDTVQVWSAKGETVASPEDGTYQVKLPTKIPVHTQFTVEIESIDDAVEGDLAEIGSLPVPENEVEAEIVRDESRAIVLDGNYPVELRNPALVSGQVTVCIESRPQESDDSVAKAHVKSYDNLLPDVGTIVSASCTGGSSVIQPDQGDYRIQLDRKTPIDCEIKAKITSITPEGVSGIIEDLSILPIEGNEVMAEVVRDEKMAKCTTGNYDIKLTNPSLITGNLQITILSAPGETDAQGTISSYGRCLPEIGDVVGCRSTSRSSVVEPENGTYCVAVKEPVPIETTLGVQIIDITDAGIEGEVVENGVIPAEGENLEGSATFGRTQVESEDGYPIKVADPASASGTVTVKIDNVTTSEIQGSILKNEGIPSVGETVHAKIEPKEHIAVSFIGDYQIYLKTAHPLGKSVVVRITHISDEINGEVVRQETKKVYNDDDEFENPGSKNDLINRGKM